MKINEKIIMKKIENLSGENKIYRENCIKAMNIKDKKERLNYIYDTVCDYLDEEFQKNNYCDFKNDVCIEKRKGNCDKQVTMGCCHKYHFITGKLEICPYFDLENKKCSTKCITCKLFTCDSIKKKMKLKDIALVNCFINPIQRLIIRYSFFTSKEKILKRLSYF